METAGRIFIVAIVVLAADPDAVASACEELETESGKAKTKWGRAQKDRRLDYLQRVFRLPELRARLCYAVFPNTKDYEAATIDAIARAIRHFGQEEYKAAIYIDALAKTKRRIYGARLHQSGIATYKVQGVAKDENNALVRLADAIAGFTRDALDDDSSEINTLFQRVKANGILIEV